MQAPKGGSMKVNTDNVRRVWLEEAGGDREARLEFLAEQDLRLLMADLDGQGREWLHFFNPRDRESLHLASRPGGGLLEAACDFFPAARRWAQLLYGGVEGLERGTWESVARGRHPRPPRPLVEGPGGVLLLAAGGRVEGVAECRREALHLGVLGWRRRGRQERMPEMLGGDVPALLAFLQALEEARGWTVPPPARALRAFALEAVRVRDHCRWLARLSAMRGRYRLASRLLGVGKGCDALEKTLAGEAGFPGILIPGGVAIPGGVEAREYLWKELEILEGLWREASRRLSGLAGRGWAERAFSRLREEEARTGKAWVGPLAGCVGKRVDVREEEPGVYAYLGWSKASVPAGKGALAGMVEVRAREVSASLGMMRSVLERPFAGPWSGSEAGRGKGRGFGRCEAPEGETCCHLRWERGRVAYAAFSLPREVNRSAAFVLEGLWLDEAETLLPLLVPP